MGELDKLIPMDIASKWKWLWYERFGQNDSELMVTPYVPEAHQFIMKYDHRYNWNQWKTASTILFGRSSITERAAVQRFEIIYLNQSKYAKSFDVQFLRFPMEELR